MLTIILAATALAATPSSWVIPKEALVGIKNPIPPANRKASAARGKALYAENCIDCHGNKGLGDGENGMYFTKPPANFTKPAFTKQPDAVIFVKMSKGRGDMPTFGDELSEQERWDLVSYLRTLAPK